MYIDIDQKLLRTGDPLEIKCDPTPLTCKQDGKINLTFEETSTKDTQFKIFQIFLTVFA